MILRNSIICNSCKEEIESKHVHDFVMCKCNSIGVDGDHKLRREYLRWGVNYTKEMVRLTQTDWRLIKDMTSDHIQAIIDGNYVSSNKFMEDLFKEELKFRENDRSSN